MHGELINNCAKIYKIYLFDILTLLVKTEAPWSSAQLAMACDTEPIPPSTYPHAPLIPSSSPIT